MRRVIVSEFVSLDGVVEEPRWTFNVPSTPERLEFKRKELFGSGGLLLGRVTYQGFAAAWPKMATDDYGVRMNEMPKFVASRTLAKAEWKNSTILKGDAVEAVKALKQKDGQDLLVFGSGTLVQALLAAGLIDELDMMVFPMVVGKGKKLFKDGAGLSMDLLESRTLGAGVVLLRYKPKSTGS